jgi:hypothetical protein
MCRRSFFNNWTRWFVWITVFGIGYRGGQLTMITLHGHPNLGIVIFITGVAGYATAGLVLGLVLVSVVTLCPQLRIAPTTIGNGALRALIVGLALGITSAFATKLPGMAQEIHSTPTSACTGSNIESQFQEVQRLDSALGKPGSQPKALAKQTDHLWTRFQALKCEDPGTLTEEQRGKYIDIMLLGSADSVRVYYDANRLSDARTYLGNYFATVALFKPIAQVKGWSKMLAYLDRVTPLMREYKRRLQQNHQ